VTHTQQWDWAVVSCQTRIFTRFFNGYHLGFSPEEISTALQKTKPARAPKLAPGCPNSSPESWLPIPSRRSFSMKLSRQTCLWLFSCGRDLLCCVTFLLYSVFLIYMALHSGICSNGSWVSWLWYRLLLADMEMELIIFWICIYFEIFTSDAWTVRKSCHIVLYRRSSFFTRVALLSQRGRAMLRVCQLLASVVQNVEASLIVSYIGYRFITAYN